MTTVQAIHYTHRTLEWQRLAVDLGLVPASTPTPEWAEFAGGGILAIHRVDGASTHAGRTDLHVLVEDLDAVERTLRATGATVSRDELAGVGAVVTARASTGVTISASRGMQRAHGDLRVLPIWSQSDVDEATGVLTALGLKERLRSDSGTWVDFQADAGGLAAFHAGADAGVTLSFEYAGDLDTLAAQLAEAGHETSVVDEAYNRTLLVRTPDGGTLWINGLITDLYGYRRAD
ncbi:hypothetical protein QE418_001042 [Microbacterium testaceum]|uniref:hypothetical protein n=1 Tax=Microbacterium TaxID=33882 RepID=UPI001AEB1DD0|nr:MULTISPECIES: hypothetical protein [Microbacterium]MDQ1111594.1 hypothetical protein [Microbacterium testaceum]MDR6097871.1 hypothetical protein [Microbacterium sp. SORGH_AS_0454]